MFIYVAFSSNEFLYHLCCMCGCLYVATMNKFGCNQLSDAILPHKTGDMCYEIDMQHGWFQHNIHRHTRTCILLVHYLTNGSLFLFGLGEVVV